MSMCSPCSPSVIPEAQGGVGVPLLPNCQGLASPPPPPWLRLWGAPRGWGKAKPPEFKLPPLISEDGCSQAPAFSAAVGSAQSPRPQRRALLVPPGPPRAESCVPGLSVFIASTCAVLWAWWPAASAPRLGATIPGRPFPDPARTPVGPSRSWSQPLCLPPLQAGPSQGCTGACPCFSSSDWEINSPKEPGCLLLVSGWGKGQGPFAAVEPPQLLDNELEVF